MNFQTVALNKFLQILSSLVILAALYWSSQYNYLLFHTIVEGSSILVAFSIFIISWNVRNFFSHKYFVFIGIAYFFVSVIDFTHMLSYEGMGIIPGFGPNLACQFWIAARYMESLSLLTAILYNPRYIKDSLVVVLFTVITSLIMLSIFYWRTFPVCFAQGVGLTPFKIVSEYIICFFFAGTIYILRANKEYFEKSFYNLIITVLVLRILSEISFTLYSSADGFSNLVGHYLKLIAFYLLYKAIIETGLRKPFELLFNNLKRKEGNLLEEIAERKKYEESLKRYEAMILDSNDAITIQDYSGNIKSWNNGAEKIYGYTSSEATSMNINNIVPREQIKELRHYIDQIMKEKEVVSFETKRLNKNGKPVDIWLTIRKLYDGNNVPIGITTTERDITEKNITQAQLRQAHKMDAIGTLAGGIAHDFNNILAAILGYADMARDEIPAYSQARYQLDQVINAGNRAKELVKQILSFSRKETQERIPVQLCELMIEAVKLIRATTPVTISIKQKVNCQGCTILADPTQVHQVIVNLCTNAIQAMDETSGTLTVHVRSQYLNVNDIPREKDIIPGPYVRLSVTDSGIGIPQENIDRIFDPYFTTKEVGKGSGMGLAVVVGIVKSYDGIINVRSNPGVGTTFDIYFPQIEAPLPVHIKVENNLPTGSEKILIVDDEKTVVEVAAKQVKQLGYSVTKTTSSLEAIQKFKEEADGFDLVITDQTMPEMTGVQLAEELQKMQPDVKILLCTGYSSKVDATKIKSFGIQGFILKPANKAKMAKTIRNILDGSSSPIQQ